MFSIPAFAPQNPPTPPPKADPSSNLFVSGTILPPSSRHPCSIPVLQPLSGHDPCQLFFDLSDQCQIALIWAMLFFSDGLIRSSHL
jgi:hypothetical protein